MDLFSQVLHSNPDILLTPAKGKCFTALDCKSGYWAMELDRSFLTTFNTPFGRYRFLRLAFGLMCSGDVIEHVDRIFDGIPGTFPMVDDLNI